MVFEFQEDLALESEAKSRGHVSPNFYQKRIDKSLSENLEECSI